MPQINAAPSKTDATVSYRSFFRMICAGIMITITAVVYELFNRHNVHENSLEYYINKQQFELFPQKTVAGSSDAPSFRSKIRIGNNADLDAILAGSYEKHRSPCLFRNSSAQNWSALNWDLWDLALHWPVAHGVLSSTAENDIGTTEGEGSGVRTIVVEHEREEGGMIGAQTSSRLPKSMLFADFLANSRLKNESM
jgi:hypothetical protein